MSALVRRAHELKDEAHRQRQAQQNVPHRELICATRHHVHLFLIESKTHLLQAICAGKQSSESNRNTISHDLQMTRPRNKQQRKYQNIQDQHQIPLLKV